MKVGDMVQYVDHASWENGGLGVVTDISQNPQLVGQDLLSTNGAVQITWLDDIEDHGWSKAIEDWAQWYDDADFEEDIKLFAEVMN